MLRHDRIPEGHVLCSRYEIETLLGVGGSAAVYRAKDAHSGDHVAVKVLDPYLARETAAVSRLERELQLLRSVQHENVVRIYSLEREGDFVFLTMEYVDGESAATLLRRTGPMAPDRAVELAEKLASALDACHRAGVLHRDVKPQNVLVPEGGEPKLVDFGVAGVAGMSDLTRTGSFLGTPDYMAPELFRSARADARSDIYALGALVYELVSGHAPFLAGSVTRSLKQKFSGPPASLSEERDAPEWLDAIVWRCLQPEPEERYLTSYELLQDLKRRGASLAQFHRSSHAGSCVQCSAKLLDGLPFCHDCGRLARDRYERGSFSVVLYRCDEPEELVEHLTPLVATGRVEKLRNKLDDLPRLLFRNVSEKTARHLASELFDHPCEVAVVDELPKRFRLPSRYLAYGCLALLPIAIIPAGPSFTFALATVLSSQAFLYGLYRRRARPLVKIQPNSAASSTNEADDVRESARRVAALTKAPLRVLLAKLVRSVLAARPRSDEKLEPLLQQALRTAEELDRYETYLDGMSVAALNERLEAVSLRISREKDEAVLAPLISEKASVEQEIVRFHEVSELRDRGHLGLLDLSRVLSGLDH